MSCLAFNRNYKYSFSEDLIIQMRDLNRLLTIELELSHECNYRCKYCYSSAGKRLDDDLAFIEICEIVDQAQNLGVQAIVIIGGGEPLLYPHLMEFITYIFSKQISIILFTNGAFIDEKIAKFLKANEVFPVLKVNGIHPKTINWLCGSPYAYKNFINALSHLQSAGYTQEKSTMGISTIICRQNHDEIVELWQWVRDNNLIPYFERVSPQGRATKYSLQLSKKELKTIFDKLSKIDKERYNIQWDSNHPPIAGSTCNRHFYSLYIKSNGDVIPCAGIDYVVGNVRDKSLQSIIIESEILQELRHIDTSIKGKCQNCDFNISCYGCRGNAYQINNDYLAEDPLCWNNETL